MTGSGAASADSRASIDIGRRSSPNLPKPPDHKVFFGPRLSALWLTRILHGQIASRPDGEAG
jgi:hypothetical protein